MSGPTTPCAACNKATPLGQRPPVRNAWGDLGELCGECDQS